MNQIQELDLSDCGIDELHEDSFDGPARLEVISLKGIVGSV